ncbi:uncharacterized protein SCHCODRAFT_01130637 [Schizophyllum commune H4-8]|uniref:Expressed protein n=1 Tax=Schizophyllum commune (strain H4-8 / FGSC 9210) TaxID=578458 RepID=D8QBS3_SCHCM|nr:uncharacterized protein SCHCODRAFT_01130637 [Schizophyllum commune H4-8]KAI5889291.1 hypothetical protein SCHCODRAFT_01130637 [Schizophyllum commune H4-8]
MHPAPLSSAPSQRLPYASSSPSTTCTGHAAPRARNHSSLLTLGAAFVLYCVLYLLPSSFPLELVCERAELFVTLCYLPYACYLASSSYSTFACYLFILY